MSGSKTWSSGYQQGEHHGGEVEGRGPAGEVSDEIDPGHSQAAPQYPSDPGNHHRLTEELDHDVAPPGPQGPADTDFSGVKPKRPEPFIPYIYTTEEFHCLLCATSILDDRNHVDAMTFRTLLLRSIAEELFCRTGILALLFGLQGSTIEHGMKLQS